ncbi:MAG: hypothetical protein H6550_05675 [Chitinophagales bacterium]|nr:hypothetical protein [Chitinophagales bacterium]
MCTSVQCENEGVCVRGECACTFGYEGDMCEKQWYQKYEGNWSSVETDKKDSVLNKYDVSVVYAGYTDTFYLLNFADTLDTVKCYRSGYKTFTIMERVLNDSFKLASGNGLLSDDGAKVTGLYSLSQKDVITNVGYTWTR